MNAINNFKEIQITLNKEQMGNINYGTIALLALFMLAGIDSANAQKKTKTFHENFKVADNAVLDINTSYADIEFETWNRDQVDIQAIIEIEGATEEQLEASFNSEPVKISGNSKLVEISTGPRNREMSVFDTEDLRNLNIDISDLVIRNMYSVKIPSLPELPEIPNMAEMPPIPPLPPMKIQHFDYEAYKKDGERYLEKWKTEFDKDFNKDYQKKMEEWGKHMEQKYREMAEKHKETGLNIEEAAVKRQEEVQEAQDHIMEVREEALAKRKEAIAGKREDRPNIFFYSDKGNNKNYKIKKTIKIKLPKSTKIKMNVRHGEVKLAENTHNMNATLSYATLLAATIDGDKTFINASYSPVSVQKWNYGRLRTDYSDKVNINEVGSLTLNATFSDVTIEKLLRQAFIKNDFGPLHISTISNSFTDLDIQVQNAELYCKLPPSAYNLVVNSTDSDVDYPSNITLDHTKNGYTTLYKGYNLNNGSGKSIVITSKFSDLTLQ